LEKYALDAEKKASNTIIVEAENPTNKVFNSTGMMVKKSSAFNPISTLFIKIRTGTIKPNEIGIKHNAIAINAFLGLSFFGEILVNLLEVSLYFWLDLALFSNINNSTIKMNVTMAIWDAADMLFIPIQTLNIPSVRV
jgi:hypothetical protein